VQVCLFNYNKMATIFSKIISGDIPSYKVAEDNEFYAFLDINPLVKAHTLVVPKREVDYIFDLEDEELAKMQLFAKRVASAIKEAFPCKKVGQAVIGLEVPHAHIHLIPIQKESDMIFSNPKLKLSSEEFVEIATSINKIWEDKYK
jgi:histidine triad (HIT) family protein